MLNYLENLYDEKIDPSLLSKDNGVKKYKGEKYLDPDSCSALLCEDMALIYDLDYKNYSLYDGDIEIGIDFIGATIFTDTRLGNVVSNDYINNSRTIGGHIYFPSKKNTNSSTLNQARGRLNYKFPDRIDQFLYHLKDWYSGNYVNIPHGLLNTLNAYSKWLSKFVNFEVYISSFHLNMFVNENFEVHDISSIMKQLNGSFEFLNLFSEKIEFDVEAYYHGIETLILKRSAILNGILEEKSKQNYGYTPLKNEINNIVQDFVRRKLVDEDYKVILTNKVYNNISNVGIIKFDVIKEEILQIDKSRTIYKCNNTESAIYLKVLSNTLNKYSSKTNSSRSQIIKSINMDIMSKQYNYITTIDYKDFYNSIDVNKIEKIVLGRYNFYQEEFRNIFGAYIDLCRKYESVLPGLSPSNILAEIYALEMDRFLRKALDKKEINYSLHRYVDDILIFSDVEIDYVTLYKDQLKDFLITLNENKCNTIELHNKNDFEYLGYKYKLKENGKCEVTISNKNREKYSNYLNNIISFYKQYINNENHTLLDSFCYRVLLHIFGTRVYKKYSGNFHTGFSTTYSELRKLGSGMECDTVKFDYNLYKKFELNKIKLGINYVPFYFNDNNQSDGDTFSKFTIESIFENNKKIIFINNKNYFSKSKIIKFINLYYHIINENSPIGLHQKSYYEISMIYNSIISEIIKKSPNEGTFNQ